MYPQQYPQQQIDVQQTRPPKQKLDSGTIIGLILVIVAFIMILISLISPWWNAHTSGAVLNQNYDGDWNAYLQDFRSHGSIFGYTSDKTQTWAQYNTDFQSSYHTSSVVASLMTQEFYLTVVAIVLVLLAIIVIVLTLVRKAKPFIAGFIIIVAFILAIIAPVLFYAQEPAALDTDSKAQGNTKNAFSGFAGSSSESNTLGHSSTTWGPAMGWYMILVAAILLLIAASFIFGSKKPASPTPATYQPTHSQAVYVPIPQYSPSQHEQDAVHLS